MCFGCGHKYPRPAQRARKFVRRPGRTYERLKPLSRPKVQQPANPPPDVGSDTTGVVEVVETEKKT